RVGTISRDLQREIGFDRTTDIELATVVERPAAVVRLPRAQIDGNLRLESGIDLIEVMHHQNVFSRNRAIGLELVQPVAVLVLCIQQRVASAFEAAIQSRPPGAPVDFQRTQRGSAGFFSQNFTSVERTVQRPVLPSERRAVRSNGTGRALMFFSAVVGPARCRAGRGERRATAGAASGSPMAARLNSRCSSQLLRIAALVENCVSPTAA